MKNLLPFGLLIFLFSCHTSKTVQEEPKIVKEQEEKQEEVKPPKREETKVRVTLGDEVRSVNDPFQILEAKIEGNMMILKVQYGGGCRQHTFDIVGSNIVALSEPGIRQIAIYHQGDGDLCKAMIVEDLKFDITSFANQKVVGSKIYLTLPNKQKLLYEYAL